MPDLIKNASWDHIRAVLADPTVQIGLFGPPGVGKTHSLFAMANPPTPPAPPKSSKQRLVSPPPKQRYVGKIQCQSEISPAEVMGTLVPNEGKWVWEPGPGDIAYREGGLLIFDEIDQLSGPMKAYAMGLFDRGPGGTISYLGRTFVQAPGYQAVATMNESPDLGILPDALMDRFDAWFLVTQPSQEQLTLLEPDLRRICEDSYSAVENPLKGPVVTFRMLHSLQKLRKLMPLEQAVLGVCKNNTKLARSLVDVLSLAD